MGFPLHREVVEPETSPSREMVGVGTEAQLAGTVKNEINKPIVESATAKLDFNREELIIIQNP